MRAKTGKMLGMTVAVLLLVGSGLRADTVFLSDGRVLRGFVMERSQATVRFMTEEGGLLLPSASVQNLRIDPSPLAECLVWARQIPEGDRMGWMQLAIYAQQQGLDRIANMAFLSAMRDTRAPVRVAGQAVSPAVDTEDDMHAIGAPAAPSTEVDSSPSTGNGEWGADVAKVYEQSRFRWMTSDDTEKVNQHRNKVGGSLYSFQPSVMAHYFYSGSTQSGSLRNGAQGWQYLFSGAGTRNDMFGRLSTRHLIDAIYGPRSGLALARYQETIMTRNLATTIDQENTVSEERAKAEGEYLRYWREEFERGRASRLSNPNWTTDGWARP